MNRYSHPLRLALLCALASNVSAQGRTDQPRPAKPAHEAPGASRKGPPLTSAELLDAIIVLGTRPRSYQTDATTIAGKLSQPLRTVPSSVSVTNRKFLDDVGATSVEDALRWTTGMNVQTQGDGTFVAYNRGYDSNAQFDGIAATKGVTSMQQLDLAIYDRVETQRGPAGLLQGSGTPGGSINLVRKRAPRHRLLQMEASAGSWNTYRGMLDAGGPMNASGSVRGRGVVTSQDNDFFYDRAHSHRTSLYGIVEFDLGSPDTTLALSAAYQRNPYTRFWGLPTYTDGRQLDAPRSTFTGTDWSTIQWVTREGVAEFGHRFGNGDWALKAAARWRDNKHDSHIGYSTSAITRGGTRGTYLLTRNDYEWVNRGIDVSLTGKLHFWGHEHDVLLGFARDHLYQTTGFASRSMPVADVFHPDIALALVPALAGSYSEFNVRKQAWYGQLRLRPFDRWTVVLGGRSTTSFSRSRDITPTVEPWEEYSSNNRNVPTPYLGAVWEATPATALYASYSWTFQLNEYFNYHNKVLDPREGWQIETGLKQGFLDDRLQGTLALYRIHDTNRPFRDYDHTDCHTAGGACWLPSGLVQSQGWEAELVGQLAKGWNISTSYTFNDAKYLKDTPANNGAKFQTMLPRHQARLWTQYDSAPGARGWFIGGGLQYQSRVWNGVNTATMRARTQASYALASLTAGWRFNRHWQADLSVRNLFDRVYYARVGATGSGNYYGEPRAFSLRVRASY